MRTSPPEMRPNPDPSSLTTEQLHREVDHLKEAVEGSKQIIDTRISAMDKALVLLQAFADKSPTTAAVDQSVKELAKLMDEKFQSIDRRFQDKDKAVDAAFAAAKEAGGEQNKSNAASIAKSEAGVIKQIDQIGTLIAANTKSVDEKIVDIKDRVTAIEGRSTGHGEVWAYIFGAAALGVATITIIAFIAKAT